MDEQPTAATPTSSTPPVKLAWGDEPDPGEVAAGASWRLVAALAASIMVSALLLISGAWSWTQRFASDPLSEPLRGATASAPAITPPVAHPPPSTTTMVAAPQVTVTITQPPPAPAPAAAPQIPAAAQEICDMLRQYPGMNRVDVALTLSDRRPHRPYDTTRPIVDNAVANYCPDQAR